MPENVSLFPALQARDSSAFLAITEHLHYADLAIFYSRLESEEERDFVIHTVSPKTFSDVLPELPDALLEDAISRYKPCLLYTSPSPRDLSTSRMPSSA